MFGTPDYNYGYPWNSNGTWNNYGTAINQPKYSAMQQQSNMSVVYIQGGDTAADSFLVATNQTVILIDNEAGKLYIKATDASGRPVPIRKFEEVRTTPIPQTNADYVTREEFEKRIKELSDAKLSIPTA